MEIKKIEEGKTILEEIESIDKILRETKRSFGRFKLKSNIISKVFRLEYGWENYELPFSVKEGILELLEQRKKDLENNLKNL